MLVGDRMTANPITIRPNVLVTEALKLMNRERIRHYPVTNSDRELVGIVSYQDLVYASPSSVKSLSMWEMNYLLSQITVREVMIKDVITVTEDCPIEEAARIMDDDKIGCLPIMRGDMLVGIITESDLFKVFLELFDAQEKGIRLTLLAPYFKGSLAQISSAIADNGGMILGFNTFRGEDSSNWGCTLKVFDMPKEELLEIIKPLTVEILDIREV